METLARGQNKTKSEEKYRKKNQWKMEMMAISHVAKTRTSLIQLWPVQPTMCSIRTSPARLNNFVHFTFNCGFYFYFFQSKHLERIMSSPWKKEKWSECNVYMHIFSLVLSTFERSQVKCETRDEALHSRGNTYIRERETESFSAKVMQSKEGKSRLWKA